MNRFSTPPMPSILQRVYNAAMLPRQCTILGVLLIACATALPLLRAAEPGANPQRASSRPNPSSKKYAGLLAAECDQLLKLSIQRPYGIGWSITSGDDDGRKKSPKTISYETPGTSSAGLILFYAGELLQQPRFTQAAREIARGIVASQQPNGKIAAQSVFNATNVISKESPSPLPARDSTHSSLALLLTLVENHEKDPENEPIVRAASRAAIWIVRQQADGGGWPVLYPPDAPAAKQSRISRLDLPETRDTTLAMLLAYSVLGEPVYRRSAERAIEFLERVRIPEVAHFGQGLWGPAYNFPGQPIEGFAELPKGADVLASRYSMQTLLNFYMIFGGGPHFIGVEKSLKSLADLPKAGVDPATDPPAGDSPQQVELTKFADRYYRWYDPQGRPVPITLKKVESKFYRQPTDDPSYVNDFGIARIIQTLKTIGPGGREKFLDRLNPHFTRNQVLAHTLAGFTDGDLPADFPAAPAEVEPYLASHPEIMARIQSAPPAELPDRILRLWSLCLRAKIESETGQ